jgi:MtN3 and saliva related transmembrane protein
VIQTIGIIAGIFTACSLLPQLIKILKEKKAKDVSAGMLLILMTGVALWIWYGVLRKDVPIVATNSFSLLLNFITFYYRIKYK